MLYALLKRIISFSESINQSPNISPNDQHLFANAVKSTNCLSSHLPYKFAQTGMLQGLETEISLRKRLDGTAQLRTLGGTPVARATAPHGLFSFQNELEQNRLKHDTDNQDRESRLDIVMDRLRQESTEEALNVCLQQCLEMLAQIKDQ